jgi:hypothetical protein
MVRRWTLDVGLALNQVKIASLSSLSPTSNVQQSNNPISRCNLQPMFSFLTGFAAFGYGIYCFYQAVKFNHLFKKGIRSKATVLAIEAEKIYSHPRARARSKIHFYLILQLPPFEGIPMTKKYEHRIYPTRYKVGEVVDIIQSKEYPTEIVVVKELTFMSNPIWLCILGVMLWLVAYFI